MENQGEDLTMARLGNSMTRLTWQQPSQHSKQMDLQRVLHVLNGHRLYQKASSHRHNSRTHLLQNHAELCSA